MALFKTDFSARSWLFAPGDSERKIAKATAGPADIVLLDLEDAVTNENKPLARKLVHDWIKANPDQQKRLWVRINPMDSEFVLDDLAAIMPANPGGIMLPKVYGRADVDRLDNFLTILEVANGIAVGSTLVFVLVTETAEAMFNCGCYKDAPRVVALTWGAEDLADSIGASNNLNPDGSYSFTYELARSMCLLGAATAGVPAIETIQADFKDLEKLRLRAEKVRRDGYRGMCAIHPDQIPVINAAFTPAEEDLAEAQSIVDLFAANPGVGAIGYKGGMVDRPHLARATLLLKQAGRG